MNVMLTCQCVNLILTVTTLLGATSAFAMLAILGMVSSTALVSLQRMFLSLLLLCVIVSDINECELDTDDCDENAECTDTIGSFRCDCNFGYMGSGRECCK